MKNNKPVYQMQKKKENIPVAHRLFLKESLAVWLKLGIEQKSIFLYNSPMFCVSKKEEMV